jgi:hypothetical protein
MVALPQALQVVFLFFRQLGEGWGQRRHGDDDIQMLCFIFYVIARYGKHFLKKNGAQSLSHRFARFGLRNVRV